MAPKRSPWYAFVRNLVRYGFFKPLGSLSSAGENHIPLEGGLIVSPNHVSHLDPPIIACAQNRRQLAFMAKEELFNAPVFGPLIRSLGAFPVKRGESDTESIRKAISLLEEGRALLVFPEGGRGDGKSMQAMNRGVAMLAKRTGAPVLPVGIVGTHLSWPKGRSKPRRARMRVAFGEPFTYAQIAMGASEKENREAFAQELRRRIVALCSAEGYDLKSGNEAEAQAAATSR